MSSAFAEVSTVSNSKPFSFAWTQKIVMVKPLNMKLECKLKLRIKGIFLIITFQSEIAE